MKLKSNWTLGGLAALAMVAGVVGWVVAATGFDPASQPTGAVAQLEVTNFDLTSGNETVFKTDYEKQDWTGNVYAYPVGADGELNTPAERWDGGAKAHLDAQNFDTGRIIVTMQDDGTKIPFRYTQLSAAQKTAVGGQSVLDFVRGDRSNETVGLAYRARASVLGDIIHSRPFYLENGGSPVLFVGANDGMLHAFDASATGGDELWAYVPSMLLSSLPALKETPYVHTYFVDGGLNVADAVISGADKKVLVSGLGAGGKGLFALDVTDPIPADETAAAAKILWEITPSRINGTASASYANLGYTYGTPLIAKVNSGSGQSAVIAANGYNASGVSMLYVIDIADGTLIKAIATSGAASGGLSTPACYDATGNGQVDYCYAGDIDGKLWKFDLSSTTASSWSASLLYTTSPAQAITMAPSIATHPNGGVMLNFGTGRMFTAADETDTAVHYVYGIWDRPAPFAANAALLTQTLTPKNYVNGSVTTRVRTVTANAPTWSPAGASSHMGWKVALPAGERVIGDTVFTESGRFYFNAYNPTITNTSPTPNGENWLMELDYLSGGVVNSPFLDLNADQLLTDADRIRYVSGDTLPAGKAIGDPISTSDGIPVGKFFGNGVAAQPILVQLETLNTTLINQNPDTTFPPTSTERGVAGGHFDVDIFYGPPPSSICNYTGGSSGIAIGSIDFTYRRNEDFSNMSITLGGGANILTATNPPNQDRSSTENWIASHINAATLADYTVNVNNSKVVFTAKNTGSAYNKTISVTATNMSSSDRTVVNITGGGTPVAGTFDDCSKQTHFHEYDDLYDVTGVNMLNASSTTLNLSRAIASTATNFKVLVHNQYLNPAVTLSVGGAAHTSVKTWNNQASETVAANVIANAPSYNRGNVNTLEWNMPVDAFSQKDWWANGDTRVGLMPTAPGCGPWYGTSSRGGNLFYPVNPPATITATGQGTVNNTSGVRHNGALTIQIVKSTIPASAIELNVDSRPEYGWRVKSADFETYVLAEYVTYWHHPLGKCYGASGWTKLAAPDLSPSDSSRWRTPAAGSDDPSTGSFRATSAIVSVATNVGTVTATANIDGTTTIVTVQPDGTTTTVTVPTPGDGTPVPGGATVTVTTYADSTTLTVIRIANSDGTTTIITIKPDGTKTVVNLPGSAGEVKTGGDERGNQAITGRVSWSELLRQ
ncbi:MAG: pilus assembly protein [Burkholderiales bacterium]